MRYNDLNSHLKTKFGEKTYKVSLDLASSCPNRDGTKGFNGCIYCNPDSNTALLHTRTVSSCFPDNTNLHLPTGNQQPATSDYSIAPISLQVENGIKYVKDRHNVKKFIAYFQHYSNTYGNPEQLRKAYFESIDHPDIVSLAISTRPDCISDTILDILEEIKSKTYLWIELGLQSANDKMLKFLNRQHNVQDFLYSLEKLNKLEIDVCAHVILGLPHETKNDILQIANLLNKNGVKGIKIHNLHVLKGTKLEEFYKTQTIDIIELEEYAKRVVFLIEHLDPKIIIHRFNSHSPRKFTIAPIWSINKLATFNAVEKEFEKQDTWQGKK